MQSQVAATVESNDPAALTCAVDIDTSAAPAAEQFDLYRSWHANLVDVTLLREKFRSFAARERVWQLGNLVLLSVDYPGTGYRRRWSNKKNPVFDHWCFTIPRRHVAGMEVGGKLRWRCLAVPHEDESEDDGFLSLFLPRDFAFSQPYDLAIRPEMAGFIADYLLLLHRSLPDRMARDVESISAATTSLLAACISPSRNHIFEAQGPIDAVIMARANRIICEQLSDPDLSPEKLCRALGVSRSRLYRIFEPAGGISSYIRRQRLLHTRDNLRNGVDRRPISAIAEEWGFADASAFSRTFRREFGMTPKVAREMGWLGGKQLRTASEEAAIKVSPPHLNSLLMKNYLAGQLDRSL